MPITPLHFGLLAPINHLAPKRVSPVSFILVNLWIDLEFILAWAHGVPLPSHYDSGHTFLVAAITAVLVAMVGVRSWPWVLGAFLGAFSHILLDSLVHADMAPFPHREDNPLYMGWMEPVSWVLLPLTVWLVAQYVSRGLNWIRTKLADKQDMN